jgi:VWFA-related protein
VPSSGRDELLSLSVNVNFVTVPVTVKDTSGHLVPGLLKDDFSVYEDNTKQNITFFTSDPFPLSAAVVLDTALPDITFRKVRDTMSALVGAFSQYDEVAVFTYGNTMQKRQDFTGISSERLADTMRTIRRQSGRTGGVPVVGGPFGTGGPMINGKPVDPSQPQVQTMPKESLVLNDAILAAAQELGRREPGRRKVLFVISDGRELGSTNGYADVLRVLLTRQISVYAVGVGNAAIPGYRQLQKIRIPGQGYGNILPKYASATGGQVYAEMDQAAIEDAYSRVTNEARNQYTIGYNTRSTPSSTYRSIEVRVHQPNLRIYTRDGYYPLPPAPVAK